MSDQHEQLPPPATFREPWQLRAYALAAVLHEQRLFDGAVLRNEPAVVRDVGGDVDGLAPRRWITALEECLCDGGHVSMDELTVERERHRTVAARDGHERWPHPPVDEGGQREPLTRRSR